jgi:uncharacterized protein (DUF1810 family)
LTTTAVDEGRDLIFLGFRAGKKKEYHQELIFPQQLLMMSCSQLLEMPTMQSLQR